MPGGRQGTKANTAHLTALPACVTIITNSCWVAGPRLEQGLLIPNQSGCLPGPAKASVLNVWLQVPRTCFYRACWVLFLNRPICAGSVALTRL